MNDLDVKILNVGATLLVKPQAMRSLWPMMTIGAPGKVRPFTFQPGAVR